MLVLLLFRFTCIQMHTYYIYCCDAVPGEWESERLFGNSDADTDEIVFLCYIEHHNITHISRSPSLSVVCLSFVLVQTQRPTNLLSYVVDVMGTLCARIVHVCCCTWYCRWRCCWCWCKRAQLTKYPQNNDKYSLVNDINNARILNVASSMRYNGQKAHNICRNRTVLLNQSCWCCCYFFFPIHSIIP